VTELAAWLTELVDSWPTGTIVERRLDDIEIRTQPSSAR
jgi:hypothetical protein